MTSTGMYRALAAFFAADAALHALSPRFVTEGLDKVHFPSRYRWIFAPIKAAASIGLLSVTRCPALARLTTVMLTVYFVLAFASHVRVRDVSVNAVAAAAFLVAFAKMAARGPHR
nr:DoxX family protein [Mycobacterium sp. URHB0044]